MFKKYVIAFLCSVILTTKAQISATDPEFEAIPVGGKEQMEQVLQTQLNLPKVILTPNFGADVIAYFSLDSAGNAINENMDGGTNNYLRNELKRMLRFVKFKRTLNLPNELRPYFVAFHVTTEKYNRYFKQKNKLAFKKPLPADSSYVVYSRADKSPEYYKNGDEGLTEFILSEIEYPKPAIENSIEGTVVVEFVVETNGYVSNLIIKQGVNGGCSEEALRLIKQTKWLPATINNKFVRYKTNYPITFSLRNINKNNGAAQTFGQ